MEELNITEDTETKIFKLLTTKKIISKSLYLCEIEDKTRYYQCIILKNKVLSIESKPLLFYKKITHITFTLAKELNGTIIRADKAIKQLKKVGLTVGDQVIIIKTLIHKNKKAKSNFLN